MPKQSCGERGERAREASPLPGTDACQEAIASYAEQLNQFCRASFTDTEQALK